MGRSTKTIRGLALMAASVVAFGLVPAGAVAAPAAPGPERLNRGLISVATGDGNFLSWRLLAGDPPGTAFTIYRDGTRVTAAPVTVTNFRDPGAAPIASYVVRPVVNGVEQLSAGTADPALRMTPRPSSAGIAASTMDVPIQVPAGGTTPDGVSYTYSANDASVGDLDGDGQWEIVLKWDPSNSKDNSQDGFTGNVFVDAYKLDGTRLWRIDLGRNIRAGA